MYLIGAVMRKSILVVICVLGFSSLTNPCIAQVEPSARPMNTNARDNQRPSQNAQQRQQQYRMLLQRFDVNKNGRLDAPEMARARESMSAMQRPRPNTNPANPSRTEGRASALKRFDKDGDGVLSDSEREEARQALMQNRQRSFGGRQFFTLNVKRNRLDSTKLMQQFDRNGDGKLNGEERRTAIDLLLKE